METLTIDSSNIILYQTCPEHISDYLEEFQDKNSHLYPSTDLTFTTPVELDYNPYQPKVGSKRKLDESFSSWTEDDLFMPSETEDNDCSVEIATGSPVNSPKTSLANLSTSFELATSTLQDSISCEPVHKKRKLDSEELDLFQSDARSRSPPGLNSPLETDIDVPPLLLSPSSSSEPVVSNQTTNSLQELRKTIQGLDPDTCKSLKDSFSRLASHTKIGDNSPFSALTHAPCSYLGQLAMSQDMLSLQILFGSPTPSSPTPMKTERSACAAQTYYPMAPAPGMYSYVMGAPYIYPTHNMTVWTDHISTKCPLNTSPDSIHQMYNSTPLVGSNVCTKSMFYSPSMQKQYLSPQYVSSTMIPQQNIYSHQAVHVI